MSQFRFEISSIQHLLLTDEPVLITGQHRSSFGRSYSVQRVINGHQVSDMLPEEAFFRDREPGASPAQQCATVIPFPRAIVH